MTDSEKIALVKTMCDETDDDIISAYLALAGNKICRIAYPFDETITEVPDKYAYVQVDAAVYLLNKRGISGQTSSTENGITRAYENADLPASMLRSIVPMAGVPK